MSQQRPVAGAGILTLFELEFHVDGSFDLDLLKLDLRNPENLSFSHIAFNLGSAEKVDEMTKRLHNDGLRVLTLPRTTGDGYYESCIVGIEGNQIEITE